MNDSKSTYEELVDQLKQQRDELRLQMHLAKQDAKDEFVEMEKKLEHLESKLKAAGREALDASKDVKSAAQLLAGEIGDAFSRIRKKLSS